MTGRENSGVLVRAEGAPLFPLFWMEEPATIEIYDRKYLTLEEMRIILLLDKFELMDSCKMIDG